MCQGVKPVVVTQQGVEMNVPAGGRDLGCRGWCACRWEVLGVQK